MSQWMKLFLTSAACALAVPAWGMNDVAICREVALSKNASPRLIEWCAKRPQEEREKIALINKLTPKVKEYVRAHRSNLDRKITAKSIDWQTLDCDYTFDVRYPVTCSVNTVLIGYERFQIYQLEKNGDLILIILNSDSGGDCEKCDFEKVGQ